MSSGDRVAIIGPSGSGKSTFVETVACARAPASAVRFLVRGRGQGGEAGAAMDVAEAWARGREDALTRLRSRTFGYVHQAGGLLAFLSVRANIALTQRLSGRSDPGLIEELGAALGIRALFASAPAQLSGGQRQRVAIARALAHRPLVVVADEPTASLDRRNAATVMRLLADAAASAGAALLVATHDEALAAEFGFTIIGMHDDPDHDGGPDGSPGRGDDSVQAVALTPFPAVRGDR
nr:ATP-binding cassette domain-containing protein [Azospirillum oleiclasticum]